MKLKPCPFCGGKGIWQEVGAQPHIFCIRCEKCWAKSIYVQEWSKQDAIEAWNTRKEK